MNYKITITYDGTRYQGWQTQHNTKNTIQERIEHSISELLGEEIQIQGAGRTDAGVHASGQIANFHTKQLISSDEFLSKISKLLPEDISITAIEQVSDRFHARLNSTGKIYTYTLYLQPDSPVFQRKYVFHHTDVLNLNVCKSVSEQLIGTHDFMLFNDNKRLKKSTQRTIQSIIQKEHDGYVTFVFQGDGFMYHMIRRMMGMILYYGEHNEAIPTDIFSIKSWPKEWPLAPAKGLTLQTVLYTES